MGCNAKKTTKTCRWWSYIGATAMMSVIRIYSYFLVGRAFMSIARFPQSLHQDKSILHDIRSRGRRDSSVSIVTKWRTGKYRCYGSTVSRVKSWSLYYSVPTVCGTHTVSYLMITRAVSAEEIGRAVKLNTYVHLAPRVKSNAVSPCDVMM